MDDPSPAARAFHAFEHAAWQSRAAGYRDHFQSLVTQATEPLLDAAGVSAGSALLDVACGPGYGTAAAAVRGARATGLDFAPAMLTLARARWPELPFIAADAARMPFCDASFDAVTIAFGMLHFAEPQRVLAEACRVLRPGGALAFTVWDSPGARNAAFKIMLDALAPYSPPSPPAQASAPARAGASAQHDSPAQLPAGPPFFQYADPEVCRRALSAAGFEAASVTTRVLPLSWTLPAPDGLMRAFTEGTARTGALILAQPPAQRRAIRDAVERACTPFQSGDRLVIPAAAALTSARKP